MKKTKFGLIGADMSLRAHVVELYYPRESAELVAICDCNPAMLEKFAADYPQYKNVRAYGDYRELIADPEVEAVFVMVRDFYHEEIAVAALNAGKAVFLEKPMAITLEGCDRILEAAYRNQVPLMVGHNMRYMPSILKMKEVIDSGMIGDIQCVWVRHFINYGSCYFRHWCAQREHCTGLLLQKGAHDIDVIHWLAGGYSTRVCAMGKLSVYNRTTGRLAPGEAPDRKASWKPDCWPPLELKGLSPKIDVEDHSMIMMQLDNGVQATYQQCMYTPDSERNYTFIGTHGRVENIGDQGECQIHVWTDRGSRRRPDVIYDLKAVEGGHGGADPRIIKAFFAFVRGEAPALITPLAARNAIAAGYLGHYSMRNGNVPMDVPPVCREWEEYFNGGQVRRS
ncbi:MAG: Gfo/Idh/MocA family oxidoreductase [Lentisphaeria bacterium]|nr:Gfo/Idh/MocA family oxidoreductase [Lentisphaeria bacterium]